MAGVNWSKQQVEARIDDVLVDAYGDDEQLGSFACVLEELLERPVDALVMGEPVKLVSVREEGLGLRAKVRRAGRIWDLCLLDVSMGDDVDPDLDLTVAAYRCWVRGLG
jgi:hypothetical protein